MKKPAPQILVLSIMIFSTLIFAGCTGRFPASPTKELLQNSAQSPGAELESTDASALTAPLKEDSMLPRVPGSDALWIPILVYHRINYSPANASAQYKSLTIEPEWFERHLQYLQENKFTVINFSDLADYFEKGAPLPARPVMINFDDGYKDTYTNAFPILKKHNMPGTVFMVAGYIGYKAYLDLDQLKELRDYGMEIGAHSMSHPSLTKAKNAKYEIEESKKVLEEKLGIKADAFAYPNGSLNDAVIEMVKAAGFRTGRTFAPGHGITGENLFRLRVLRVDKNIGLENWNRELYPEGQP